MMKAKIIILLFLQVFFYWGCKNPPQSEDNSLVMVSIMPQKYFVNRIADTLVKVEVLVPTGASPETFEPSAQQLKTLSKSSLYFNLGTLDFENALLTKLKGISTSTKFVNLSNGIDLIEGSCSGHDGHNHNHGVDPHTWSSPRNVRIMATSIHQELCSQWPQHKKFFTESLQVFLAEIDSLDIYMEHSLSNPKIQSFFVYHPALTYLARDYNLTQVALEEEGKSPSMVHMKKSIESAKHLGIKTLFIQKEFDVSALKTAAKDIEGRIVVIDPLDYNWLENMYQMTNLLVSALNGE